MRLVLTMMLLALLAIGCGSGSDEDGLDTQDLWVGLDVPDAGMVLEDASGDVGVIPDAVVADTMPDDVPIVDVPTDLPWPSDVAADALPAADADAVMPPADVVADIPGPDVADAEPVADIAEVVEASVPVLATGTSHTCATDPDLALRCFGYNGKGQLGDNSTDHHSLPVVVEGLPGTPVEVAGGFLHTCALTDAGAVWCWGNNTLGQLGDGTDVERHIPGPVSGLDSGVRSIASLHYHTCAVVGAGSVRCFGDNADGQLGVDKAQAVVSTPIMVPNLSATAKAVTVGANHTCVLYGTGAVGCFGANSEAQLGDGTLQGRHTPAMVVDLPPVVEVQAGFLHTCALTSEGAVWCWGQGVKGQLGDGDIVTRNRPVVVAGLPDGIEHLAIGSQFSCAWGEPGLWCWGANADGQLGRGETSEYEAAPAAAVGLTQTVLQVAAGGWHTCVRLGGGVVRCAGWNNYGQLGDGSEDSSATLIDVAW